MEAGSLRNAIPREAWALLSVSKAKLEGIKGWLDEFTKTVKNEYKTADPDLKVAFEIVDNPPKVMDDKSQTDFINAIYACPQRCCTYEQRHGEFG